MGPTIRETLELTIQAYQPDALEPDDAAHMATAACRSGGSTVCGIGSRSNRP